SDDQPDDWPGDRPGDRPDDWLRDWHRDWHRAEKRHGDPGRANHVSTTTSVPVPRHATGGPGAGGPGAGRARRLLRGPQADPRWARPALCGLLALTAVLYLWNLTRNGWANDFYAAAVQAGTKSWKA